MTEAPCADGNPALTDQQTGLPNRLHFDTVLKAFFATGRRGLPLSLILLGIDGAAAWLRKTDVTELERTLRGIGALLVPMVRDSDILARFDEGRFALCLIGCNLAGAALVADRIDGLLDTVRSTSKLGFSIGGATLDSDMGSFQDLTGAAEEALRVAQGRGSDQIEFRR